ncbi:hypothetical protein [Halorubrum tibetense]|uniref:Uncharacterized protein n=1 Tax=Halorubrum tibetense TaxID=175631 RepID=A0ABD5S8V0_9EURY
MSAHDLSVGIDHPTVVPTNFDRDSRDPEADTVGSPAETPVDEGGDNLRDH